MRGFICKITGVRQQERQCISSEDAKQVMTRMMEEGYVGIHLAVGVQLLALFRWRAAFRNFFESGPVRSPGRTLRLDAHRSPSHCTIASTRARPSLSRVRNLRSRGKCSGKQQTGNKQQNTRFSSAYFERLHHSTVFR
jgi:hypothetical protein